MAADALLDKVSSALEQSRENGLALANDAVKSAKDKKSKAPALLALALATRHDFPRDSKHAATALKSAKEALALFKELKDKKGEGLALVEIAKSEAHTERALQAARGATEIFSELKDKKGELAAARAHVSAHLAHAGPEAGLLASQRALELAKEVGNPKDEADELQNMLGMHLKTSDTDGAMKVANEAFKLAKETKDNESYMTTLSKVLLVHNALKNPDEARRSTEDALKLFKESGDKSGEAGCLCLLSHALLEASQNDEALKSATKALDLYKDLKDQKGVLNALKALLEIVGADRSKMGILMERDMINLTEDVIKHFLKLNDKHSALQAKRMQAVVFFETNQPRQAVDVLAAAREMHKELKDTQGEESLLQILISYHSERDELPLAMQAAGELFALYLSLDDQRGQVDALLFSSRIHLQMCDSKKAMEVAKDALGVAKEAGDKKLQLEVLTTVQSILSFREGGGDDKEKKAPQTMKQISDAQKEAESEGKAIDTALQILELSRELDDPFQEVAALFSLAQLTAARIGKEQKKGELYTEPMDQCREAVEILQDANNQRRQLPILEFIYTMQRGQGQAMEAVSTARDILAIMQDLDKPAGAAGALILIAEAGPETMEGLQSAEEASNMFEAMGQDYGQAVASHLLFKAYFAQDNFEKAQEMATIARDLFKAVDDVHGQAVCGNAIANATLQQCYKKGLVRDQVAEKCMWATYVAREALDHFHEIDDKHGKTLSLNIIRDMKKVNDMKGNGTTERTPETAYLDWIDVMGKPMVDPYENEKKSTEGTVATYVPRTIKPRPAPHKPQGSMHGILTVVYTPYYPKTAPTRSDEHNHLMVVGQYPNLFRSVLKARPSLAADAIAKMRAKRGTTAPRGVAAPMRLVSQECIGAGVQEGITGCVLSFVDHDKTNHFDIIDIALKVTRICNPDSVGDMDSSIPLDFVTAGQLHASPDALPELRHPLHGTLSGFMRAANNEYFSQIRYLDIEPPHKRTPTPQLFYKGDLRKYVEGIVRKGILFVPRIVGGGMAAKHPVKFEYRTGAMPEKLYVDDPEPDQWW